MDSSLGGNDIEVLPRRVAGHGYVEGAKAGVACEKSSGFILKVIDGDERGQRELEFYQELNNSNDPKLIKLRSFCPTYHGTRIVRGRTFLRLGNVTFDSSNVMDVKIGAVTWDHKASEEKVRQEKSKYMWQELLGFKILGYRFTKPNGQVEVLEKEDAKKLNPEKVHGSIRMFLSPECDEAILQWRRRSFVRQLEQIKELIEDGLPYQFISSSILFSYKNVPYIGDSEQIDEAKATMIDFAHTFHTTDYQVDTNYLKGLSSLISFFNSEP